jgi:outer membrane protein assembly factor BamD
MSGSHKILKILLVGIPLIFLLEGCALFDRFFGEEEEKPAAQLMAEGTEDMEKGDYEGAADAFQKVKDRYPYSKFAVTAELNLSEALYKRELYGEAFDAYSEFERLHPKNKEIPHVIFKKGMCQFLQSTAIDRDQSFSQLAKKEFERLVKRFPRSEYARKARMKIRSCLINLAEYELYVGHFYFKSGKYRAALGRYRYIILNYPDLGQYHEALYFLGECQRRLAKKEKSS